MNLVQQWKNIDFDKTSINVISHEGLIFPFQYLNNPFERTLKRFWEVLSLSRTSLNLRVVMTYREPDEMLETYFGHFFTTLSLIDPKLVDPKKFFDLDFLTSSDHGKRIVRVLKFDYLIAQIPKKYPFTVLQFADLRSDKTKFLRELQQVFGEEFKFAETLPANMHLPVNARPTSIDGNNVKYNYRALRRTLISRFSIDFIQPGNMIVALRSIALHLRGKPILGTIKNFGDEKLIEYLENLKFEYRKKV